MIDPDHDPNHVPMQEVPDGVPILTVASITPGGEPQDPGFPIGFKQVSIEVYTPITDGLNMGGGFSPDGFIERRGAPAAQPAR